MLDACEALPRSVQVLCVTVDDLAHLGVGSGTILSDLQRFWRESRPRGAFRRGGALARASADFMTTREGAGAR